MDSAQAAAADNKKAAAGKKGAKKPEV